MLQKTKRKPKRTPVMPHLMYRKGNSLIESFLKKQEDLYANRQTNNSIEPSDLRK